MPSTRKYKSKPKKDVPQEKHIPQEKDTKSKPLMLEDVTCPICLSIMIEPVTMPCKHTLCLSCFKSSVYQTALSCPVCRRRIAVWTRRNTISNNLIDAKLWEDIQKNFKEQVDAHMNNDDNTEVQTLTTSKSPSVSKQGEVRKEYETMMASFIEEQRVEEEEEIIASMEIITKLELENKKKEELNNLCADDFKLAKKIRKDQLAKNFARRHKTRQSLDFSPIGSPSQKGPMYSYLESTPNTSQKYKTGIPMESKILFNKSDESEVNNNQTRPLKDNKSSQNSGSDSDDSQVAKMSENSLMKLCNKENLSTSHQPCSSFDAFLSPSSSSKQKNGSKPRLPRIVSSINSISNLSIESNAALRLSTSNELLSSRVDSPCQMPATSITKPKEGSPKNNDSKQNTSSQSTCNQELLTNVCSDLDLDSEEWKSLVNEQKQMEERIQQEMKDHKLALRMQKDMTEVNRRKGTTDEYSLRNLAPTNPYSSTKTNNKLKRARSPNQSSIIESFAKRKKLN